MASSQCCANPPALDSAAGLGSAVEDLGGLRCYVAGSPDSGLAVLLASDVFGFEAPNLRKIADKVAAAGFFVVVPDFFYGEAYAPENAEKPIPVWLKSHPTEKGHENAKNVVTALKLKGLSSVGAAGFCWGAKVVTELAKSGDMQTGVLIHPSLVKLDDIKEVKSHLAILGAEVDNMCPPELVKQFEEVLSSNTQLESFVKIFPGVSHGWTVRFDDRDEFAVKKAEEAHQDLVDWLNRILKA